MLLRDGKVFAVELEPVSDFRPDGVFCQGGRFCPSCDGLIFASETACRRCPFAKPTDHAAGGHSGVGGGSSGFCPSDWSRRGSKSHNFDDGGSDSGSDDDDDKEERRVDKSDGCAYTREHSHFCSFLT